MLKRIKLSDSVLKYVVVAILLAVPLYPKFPLIRIPNTFVSIRLEDLLIAFGAALGLIMVFSNLQIYLKDKLNQSIFLFLAVGFLSFISATLLTKTVTPHIAFLHWLRRVEYFVPFFLGLIIIKKSRADLEFYFKIILIVVFFSFLYGLGQRYLNWPIIITQNEEYSKGVALRWIAGSHINSTFAGHYDLATFLVLVLPIVISGFFLVNGLTSKTILFASWFSGLWLLVNTASRISLISYLLATSFSLIFIKKYRAILYVLFISLAFTGFSSNLLDRYARIIDVSVVKIKNIKLNDNLFSKEVIASSEAGFIMRKKGASPTPTPVPVFEDRSTNIRFNVEWPRAIRAFFKNPLLGTGYSSITLATDNDYLRLFGEVGLLGFLAFFLIFLRIGKLFFKVMPFLKHFKGLELAFVAGVFGSLPGLFLNAIFIDIFEASKFATIFWLSMGIAVGLVKYVKNGKNY